MAYEAGEFFPRRPGAESHSKRRYCKGRRCHDHPGRTIYRSGLCWKTVFGPFAVRDRGPWRNGKKPAASVHEGRSPQLTVPGTVYTGAGP